MAFRLNSILLLRLGLGLVGFALLLTGCRTVGGLTRDTADSTRLIYQSPASAVFAAAVAAVGDGLEIVGQDPRLREIRLRRESYMNGILLCHGHVMAVFLSPDGETRTRVEIVERTVSRLQPIGCHAETPAYVERLDAKLGVVHTTGQRRRSPERFVDVGGAKVLSGYVTRGLGSNWRPIASPPLSTTHDIADGNGFLRHPLVQDLRVGTGEDLEFSGRTAGIGSQIAYTALPGCVTRRRPVAG